MATYTALGVHRNWLHLADDGFGNLVRIPETQWKFLIKYWVITANTTI